MRVYFSNLGCKLNQAELEKLARQFHGAGHEVVASVEEADLHVVNSCTVTHLAARTSRKVVRRGKRQNSRLRTVLTGCYASENGDGATSAAGLAEVDLLVPNDRKEQLLELVHEAFPEAAPCQPATTEVPVPYVPLEFGNTRALVKVEDGCNMRCSFCIIPFTRGRQRSRTVAECVDEVQGLANAGYQEVVVTGVQISSYKSGDARLFDLVRTLLDETDVPRLRLTSIAPWQLDERLLDLWQCGRLCRHIHMSLQSGCTETLRRMRRPYTAERYAEVATLVREAIPGLALTTDVIVGFPGETQEEFQESLAFVEAMAFARVHVFPYSPRQGTLAADLPDPVDVATRRRRASRMAEAAAVGERAFRRRHLGKRTPVLWEGRRDGLWQGMTDNYLRVFSRSGEDLVNRITPTNLLELREDGVLGAPLVA